VGSSRVTNRPWRESTGPLPGLPASGSIDAGGVGSVVGQESIQGPVPVRRGWQGVETGCLEASVAHQLSNRHGVHPAAQTARGAGTAQHVGESASSPGRAHVGRAPQPRVACGRPVRAPSDVVTSLKAAIEVLAQGALDPFTPHLQIIKHRPVAGGSCGRACGPSSSPGPNPALSSCTRKLPQDSATAPHRRLAASSPAAQYPLYPPRSSSSLESVRTQVVSTLQCIGNAL
jgi:hypothetical protein